MYISTVSRLSSQNFQTTDCRQSCLVYMWCNMWSLLMQKNAIIHKYCLTIFVEMQVKFNFQWFLHMDMLQNLRIRLKAPRHSQVTTVRTHWLVVICFMLRSNVFLGASPGNQDTPMLVFKIWKYIMDSLALNYSDLWQYFTCGVTL
jgi:hypothetical protein